MNSANHESINQEVSNSPRKYIVIESRRIERFVKANYELILLAMILITSSILRLYQLDQKSLWVDEIGQAWYARVGPIAAIKGALGHIGAMPLDYLIMYFVTRFGSSDFVIRLPSVIWGICSVIAIHWLGKRIYNSIAIGLISAFLLAISPMQIYYSQEARFYSLFTFLTILSSLFFFNTIQRNKNIDWIILFLVLLLSLYTHYYTVIILLCMWMFSILNFMYMRRRGEVEFIEIASYLKKMFLVSFLLVVLALPWVLLDGLKNKSPFQFVFPPLEEIFIIPAIGYGHSNNFLGTIIFPALAVIGVAFGVIKKNIFQYYLELTIIIAVCFTLSADYLFSYFYNPRQILYVLPFYFILASCGIWWISTFVAERVINKGKADNRIRVSFALILLISITIFLFPRISNYFETNKSVNMREIATMLSLNIQDIPLIATSNFPFVPNYLIYYQPTLNSHVISESSFSSLENNQRAWAITTPDDINRIIDNFEINAVPLQADKFDHFTLYYLGKAETDSLIEEISRMEIPLAILANSNILSNFQRTDPDAMIDHIDKTLNIIPNTYPQALPIDYGRFYSTISRIYLDMGETEKAKQYTLQAIKVKAVDLMISSNAGFVFLQTNQCEEAITQLSKTIKFYPDQFSPHYFLGRAYDCNEQWELAVREYDMANSFRPGPAPLFRKANSLVSLGKTEDAIQILEEILEKYPTYDLIMDVNNLLDEITN